MKQKLPMLLLLAVYLLVGACSTVPDPQQPTEQQRAVRYVCDGGKTITATYLREGNRGTSFVVLDWNGQEYGLAQAVSGSGARYAGLNGPTVADHGLQWWEAKGRATLGAFTGKDFFETRPLLTNCKPED